MNTQEFMENNKDTKKIVSMQYESGPYDHTLTAYPKGIMNPHFVEFKATSIQNWKRMSRLLEEAKGWI
tara:strand:+ start:55 stop:258 length:204 start_codon:yes stop_codon:yes gene_type:complete